MPRDTRIEDHDIVTNDILIRALLEFYDYPHTIKEAQQTLTSFHPEDIRVLSTSLINAGFLTKAAKGWRYELNNNGIAHLKRLKKLGHQSRYLDQTEIPV